MKDLSAQRTDSCGSRNRACFTAHFCSENEAIRIPAYCKTTLTLNLYHDILEYTPMGITGGDKVRQCMDADNLHRRINKIMGQIKAIDKMIDQDIPCEDVLIQINAAKSALHKVGQVVLEGHLNHCVREGIEHGDADKTIADFAKAVEQFSRLT